MISPNVKYIDNQNFDSSVEKLSRFHKSSVTTIHDDIIVIDVKSHSTGNVRDEIQDAFNDYENAGYLYPVSVTGLKDIESGVGSHRFCTQSKNSAYYLSKLMQENDAVSNLKGFDSVSAYFRVMRYVKGGEHYPHYDSDHVLDQNDFGEKTVTKYSMVVYLTNNQSGEIAFINDPHDVYDPKNNVFAYDWNRQATNEEIYLKILPKYGRIVLFPHDKCHSVLPFTDDNERIMIRGDLIFKE